MAARRAQTLQSGTGCCVMVMKILRERLVDRRLLLGLCVALLALAAALPVRAQQRVVPVRYQGEVSVGYGFAVGSQPANRLHFETVHGVLVGSALFCGAGVACNTFNDLEWELVPLFVQVRCYPVDRPVSPYVAMDAGYSFVGLRGCAGVYLHPSFGLSCALFGRTALNTSLGMQLQRIANGANGISWQPAVLWRVGIAF